MDIETASKVDNAFGAIFRTLRELKDEQLREAITALIERLWEWYWETQQDKEK